MSHQNLYLPRIIPSEAKMTLYDIGNSEKDNGQCKNGHKNKRFSKSLDSRLINMGKICVDSTDPYEYL